MAWTSPKTWSVGEVLTSTDMNTYVRDNTEFLFDNSVYNASAAITATNASWPVPTLANPIVRVTVVGGGSGGSNITTGTLAASGAGGTTTFNAGGGISVSAAGGPALSSGGGTGPTGSAGFRTDNGGRAGRLNGGVSTLSISTDSPGFGGELKVAYLDLTGVSTVNVTVGAGGAGATGGNNDGGAGGRGEVFVEYVAG